MSGLGSSPVLDLSSRRSSSFGSSGKRRGSMAERSFAIPSAAAAAKDHHDIIEISSDDDDDNRHNLFRSFIRRKKRQRVVNLNDDDDDDDRKPSAVSTHGDFIDLSKDDAPSPIAVSKTPTLRVLDVFPDADAEQVTVLLQQKDNNVEAVVQRMVDKGYKKVEIKKRPVTINHHNTTVSIAGSLKWSYDFMASDSFEPSASYIVQARKKVLSDFPFLANAGVDYMMQKHGHHYAKVHDAVMTALKGSGDDATKYRNYIGALKTWPTKEQIRQLNSIHPNQNVVLKNPRKQKKSPDPSISDEVLKEEVNYVQSKLNDFLENGRKHETMEQKKEAAVKSNTAVECSCCFDGFDIDDMVACAREGHLFCVDCLRHCVETQIFGNGSLGVDKRTKKPALEITCFHGEGCSSGFNRSTLEKALPSKTLSKYDELQFKVQLDAAGLDSIVTCPKCEFQAQLAADVKVFVCPVESCGYESCRECGEAAHIPLRCDEVEKEAETKGRLTVEEAISQAKIRHCPRCKKAFVKESGCNKISCGCGTKICYICRKTIDGYGHFCQKPHCNHKKCGKCVLYTNADEDDERAMREAGFEAAATVAESVKIDVNGILKKPPAG